MTRLVLPWPPSVNRMWRTVRLAGSQRTLLSAEARRYREAARVACAAGQGPLTGRLRVTLYACPPDRRRRDLDNLQKAVLDEIEQADTDEAAAIYGSRRQAAGGDSADEKADEERGPKGDAASMQGAKPPPDAAAE